MLRKLKKKKIVDFYMYAKEYKNQQFVFLSINLIHTFKFRGHDNWEGLKQGAKKKDFFFFFALPAGAAEYICYVCYVCSHGSFLQNILTEFFK